MNNKDIKQIKQDLSEIKNILEEREKIVKEKERNRPYVVGMSMGLLFLLIRVAVRL